MTPEGSFPSLNPLRSQHMAHTATARKKSQPGLLNAVSGSSKNTADGLAVGADLRPQTGPPGTAVVGGRGLLRAGCCLHRVGLRDGVSSHQEEKVHWEARSPGQGPCATRGMESDE